MDDPVSEKIQCKGPLHLPGGPEMDSPGIRGGENRACVCRNTMSESNSTFRAVLRQKWLEGIEFSLRV